MGGDFPYGADCWITRKHPIIDLDSAAFCHLKPAGTCHLVAGTDPR
jgi:hypothetical protein